MMKTIKVSEKGQIAIPRPIRTKLNIQQGDELIIAHIDNKIILEKTDEIKRKITDEYRDVLRLSEQSLQEVWDNTEDDVWNHYLREKPCKYTKKK